MIWRARATRVVLAIARCPGIVKGGGGGVVWSRGPRRRHAGHAFEVALLLPENQTVRLVLAA
jgi:hypothetical protein